MGDWAKETADRIRAEHAAHDQDSARFVEEQRLRRKLAPQLFAELKAALKGRSRNLNDELGKPLLVFDVCPNIEAVVRRLDKPAQPLRVEFDAEALRVHYSCGSGRGEYLFRVNADTTLNLETAYHIPYSPEELAEQLLDLLFKSQF